MRKRLIVAITGASGVIYGKRLLEILREKNVETYLIISKAGEKIIERELGMDKKDFEKLADHIYDINDLESPLTSGTLWGFDYYIDILGLDKDRVAKHDSPSPFPKRNWMLLVDNQVTSKYELREEMREIMLDHLVAIIRVCRGRIAIYFPSYGMLHTFSYALPSDFVEGETLEDIRGVKSLLAKQQAVLLGVARGKLAEGVDLTEAGESLLDAVVIAGLPYPKKTPIHERLLEFYRQKYGKDKARLYGLDMPCVIALAQMAGRLIRSEKDKGAVIVLDKRFRYLSRLLPLSWREKAIECREIGVLTQLMGTLK